MNKSILWLIGLLFVTSLSIVSCSETDGTEDPYANWEERNQRYIDSIATVAEANRGNGEGQWKIIRSYKLPSLGLNETGRSLIMFTVRFRKWEMVLRVLLLRIR